MTFSSLINLNTLEITYTLEEEIKKAQVNHPSIEGIKQKVQKGTGRNFAMMTKVCFGSAPDYVYLSKPTYNSKILREAHESPYSIHPEGTKMYRDLKKIFWWQGMRRDIAYYISCCNVCNKVKDEHQNPVGLLQPLQVSQQKWDNVCMDFIIGLRKSS